jgi:hypothetical protein
MGFIGDSTCKYNALSSTIRCAINPCGPCQGCPEYTRASLGDRLKHRLWILDKRNVSSTKNIAFQILKGALGGIFVGAPLGLLLGSTIVIPVLNQIIVETHPCWPALGVSQYCGPHVDFILKLGADGLLRKSPIDPGDRSQ